ncbi:hypothetical protein [Pedobacter sp. Leaf216]|uniref:hypothetical protein n=1 Tax=Pedobacter sp. Leaf216 TaxID=1735684 RepID=UPI0012F984D6|nr:hypothetical protein [Pedobacter sp. Leaf216]
MVLFAWRIVCYFDVYSNKVNAYCLFASFFSLLVFVFVYGFSAKAQQSNPTHISPKVTGYFSVLHPIGTWNNDGFHDNFSGVYTLVFPFGMNIIKSDKFGISFEVAPGHPYRT